MAKLLMLIELQYILWSLYNTKVVEVKKDLVKYFDQPKTKQLSLKITSDHIYIL